MKEELRSAIFSRWFLIAFVLMFLTLLGMSFPERLISINSGEENRMSALQLALLPIFFGGVMLIFPFSACTVSAHRQTGEIRSGYIQWALLRGGARSYAIRKLSVNFLASGLAVGLAFFAHAMLWRAIAWPSQALLYSQHEIPSFINDVIYAPWMEIAHGLPIILWMTMGMLLMGGVWGTVGLVVSMWVPDALLSVSVPTFLYFLWNSGSSRWLGYRLPSASRIYNDALTWPIVFEVLAVNFIWMLLLCLLYWLGLKRRAYHA